MLVGNTKIKCETGRYKIQQAVVERVCDENLEQGASYFQRGKYFAGLRVFVENFAAQILQPPQRDQGSL
jgi:hypothetical protein